MKQTVGCIDIVLVCNTSTRPSNKIKDVGNQRRKNSSLYADSFLEPTDVRLDHLDRDLSRIR